MTLPALSLDYQRPGRRASVLGILILVLALLAAAALWERERALREEIDRLQAGHATDRPVRAPPRTDLDQYFRAIEAVRRELALPWAAIVRSLEAAAAPEVALLQMQPQAREGLIRLVAEAPSEQAMLEYLRRLGSTEALEHVHLASHQVVADTPQRPIHFTVLARLRGKP